MHLEENQVEHPVHRAAVCGSTETSKVDFGIDVNEKNNQGQTALHEATGKSNREVENFLVKSGADLKTKDQRGQTLLHVAACYNNHSMIEFLISRGLDVNAVDKRGLTPLHVAAIWNEGKSHIATIKTLLENKANIYAESWCGKTPLQTFERRLLMDPEIRELLSKYKSNQAESSDQAEGGKNHGFKRRFRL